MAQRDVVVPELQPGMRVRNRYSGRIVTIGKVSQLRGWFQIEGSTGWTYWDIWQPVILRRKEQQ